jgi:hypothetical protein
MSSCASRTAGTSGADASLAAVDSPYVTGTVLHVDCGARHA